MARVPDLPDDVISIIISCSLLHTTLYNPTLYLGPNTTWARTLRHKNAIVLVCRQWNALGTPFLYREVVIRRYGQLSKLIHTLVDTTHALLIRKLVFCSSCYVHQKSATSSLFSKNVGDILRLCPRLTSLRFDSYQPITIPDYALSKVALPKLTRLELSQAIVSEEREPLLREFSEHLRHLSISVIPGDNLDFPLSLPLLQELRISFDDPRNPPLFLNSAANPIAINPVLDVIPTLPGAWKLPCLRRLSISLSTWDDEIFAVISGFVAQYGQELHFLAMFCRGEHIAAVVVQLLEYCPKVEHLSFDLFSIPPGPSELKPGFPNVKRIDAFAATTSWSSVRSEFPKHVTMFPALENATLVCDIDVGNIFEQPIPAEYDPIHVLTEAFSWLRPDIDTGPDFSLDRTEFVGIHGNYICVHSVEPSTYHPLDDNWGDGSVHSRSSSLTTSDGEDSFEELTTSESGSDSEGSCRE